MENLYTQAMEKYNNSFIEDSKILFQKIVDKEPTHHQSINMLGLIANLENDIELSIKYIQKAVELKPKEGSYRNNLGVVFLIQNDIEKAQSEFLEAIKYSPDNSEAFSNCGFTYYKKGEYQRAKEMFEKALSFNPENIQAYMHGANLCRDMNDINQALGHYSSIIRLDPKHLEAHLRMAETYYELNIFNEALEFYLKAADIDPTLLTNTFVKATINQIYTKLFPSNRYSFYNNKELLELYEKWIDKNIDKDKKVLEYSDAEGILSLRCAKNGASNIDLIIVEPFLAMKSAELGRDNALGDKIKMITKEPSDLEYGKEIDQKADILIADIFRGKFPSYRDQLLVKSLKEKFLTKTAQIFPLNIKLMAAPISSEELYKEGSAKSSFGLDIKKLHDFRAYYLYERLNYFDYDLLSDPIEIYNFSLGAMPEESWYKNFSVDIKDTKECHGMVMWFVYELDSEYILDENPILNKKQNYLVHLFDDSISLNKENNFIFDIDYSDFPIISNIKKI